MCCGELIQCCLSLLLNVGSNADVTLRLVDGNQDQLFTLTDSGVVTLAASLNETTQESYVLSVTAHDGGQPFLSSITSVEITVTCSSSGRCPSKSTSGTACMHCTFMCGICT